MIIAVAFVTMALSVSARTAFSLMFPPIVDEFGWDRGLAAGAFSFGFLVSAAISPVLGRLVDRRGPALRDRDRHADHRRGPRRRHADQPRRGISTPRSACWSASAPTA